MAKVILTIDDKDEETISVSLEFDPPLKDDDEPGPAHSAAMRVMRYLSWQSVTGAQVAFRKQDRPVPMNTGFARFIIDGLCCYCGGPAVDGVPYGTGIERREICGGDHGGWTGRSRPPRPSPIAFPCPSCGAVAGERCHPRNNNKAYWPTTVHRPRRYRTFK